MNKRIKIYNMHSIYNKIVVQLCRNTMFITIKNIQLEVCYIIIDLKIIKIFKCSLLKIEHLIYVKIVYNV